MKRRCCRSSATARAPPHWSILKRVIRALPDRHRTTLAGRQNFLPLFCLRTRRIRPAVLSDIEIAQQARMQRIAVLARERLGIAEEHLEPYGHFKAKLSLASVDSLKDRPEGKLILVTAISPTPAGEGKTTTTVGL